MNWRTARPTRDDNPSCSDTPEPNSGPPVSWLGLDSPSLAWEDPHDRPRPRRIRRSPQCIPWRYRGIRRAGPNHGGWTGWQATIVVVLRVTAATASQAARIRINATALRVMAKAINGEHGAREWRREKDSPCRQGGRQRFWVSGSGSARLETTSSAILPSTSRDLCHWISCGPRPCSSAERRVKVFSSPIATNRPSDFGIRWQRSTRRLTRHITIHHSGSVIAHGGGDSCDGMEWIHGGLGARAGGRGDLVSPQAGRTGSTGLTHAVNGVVRSPEPAFSS